MVKPKKGKRASESETAEDKSRTSSVSISAEDMDSDSEVEVKPPKPQLKKKGKNKDEKKKKASDSDEEVEHTPAPAKGGFALLMDDDSEDEQAAPAVVDEDDDDVPAPVVQKGKPNQEKGGKKGKKGKRKKNDDDDEDLDQVLAELQLEYAGEKPAVSDDVIDKKEAKKAKQKEKKKAAALAVESVVEEEDANAEKEASGAKSAAQKKKGKKKDAKRDVKEDTPENTEKTDAAEGDEEDVDDKKGKKKKKGAKEEKAKDPGKGPGKKTIQAMQEALKKIKEEEERLKREEEERIRLEEEEERKKEEAMRIEKERKEKKKQKEKERKERAKAEGRLLTAKQKQDKARAQELIESLKAQGLELPERGEKTTRPGTRIKPNKKAQLEQNKPAAAVVEPAPVAEVEVVIVDPPAVPTEPEVKDAWDAESSADEADDVTAAPNDVTDSQHPVTPQMADVPEVKQQTSVEKSEENSDESDGSGSDSESDDGSDEESDDSQGDNQADHKSVAEKRREKALARIAKRKEEAEKKRSLDYLRAAVVCVLGHVDTGKTKILDKLRRTNVQVGEAGGITQQIGATNVPIENIKDNCKLVKGFNEMELKLPGLLIIDTPGHESFSNLRSRGSSLCDIAILVVDIMHGLEPQTLESINLLKSRKTPFIVALNKIDRLYDWQTMGRKDVRDIMKAQAENTQMEFEQRTKQVIVEFAEQGLNAALFYDSPDLRSYVSLVPTSAITGEGMGNLLALIVEFCQTMLAKRLMYSELLQATVLEVKMIPGLGTTIDCILINGKLAEGDTIVLAGTDGPVITQIRSLLMPQPMKELRVKNAYIEYKEIKAAQGVKIAGKDLEKAIAGLNLQVAEHPDEVEIFSEAVARELKTALSSIKLKDRGVYVQASTLGSLEALLEFLRTSKIPVSGIRIGPVVKKDVMKASIMLEHESQYATILAFDVKIERDAQDLADSLGVKIFQADIIYHLFDKFMAYREELKQKKREEFKNIAVFPCKIRILPTFVFNSRDPIVMGVMIEAGILKEGTPICVPSKEFLYIGTVSGIEANHKSIESARKGMEVCIKIENTTGEAPKMFGRHFDETDILTSRISRQSIDACKDYFRDDLTKTDWQLMVELKKLFQIM